MILCITVFVYKVVEMSEKVQIGIDIETVGKYDSCVITRIALTPFYFSEKNITFEELCDRTLVIALDQDEQVEKGRFREVATEEWWNSQSEELKVVSYYKTKNDMKILDAFEEIKKFLKKHRYDYMESHLWARNSGFECFKIQSLSELVYGKGMDMKVLNGWNWQDFKTLNLILTGGQTSKWTPKNVDMNKFMYHNPAHDSALDCMRSIQLVNGFQDE